MILFERLLPEQTEKVELLFEWRQTSYVSRSMGKPFAQSLDGHKTWVKNFFENVDNCSWIITLQHKEIGYCDIRGIYSKKPELGFFLGEQGYTHLTRPILQQFYRFVREQYNVQFAFGVVRADNKVILKIHRQMGWRVIRTIPNCFNGGAVDGCEICLKLELV